MRICTKCREQKPLAAFSKDKKGRGGLRAQCKSCDSAAVLARRALTPERAAERMRQWRESNKEHVAQSKADYKQRNPECDKEYYAENRERKLSNAIAWKRVNSERHAANQARRRARMKQQMPKWANREAIVAIYRQCQEMRRAGQDMQVDHIVPLNGATVSGLHCEANLQIIPSVENSAKRNLCWPGMPV